jgi:hypothetical protein
MPSTFDFKKAYKELYAPSAKHFTVVKVPALNYLMIDGKGEPESKSYQASVEALYTASYTLKFTIKKAGGKLYGVPPLEGLWWAKDMSDFASLPKSAWLWTMMIPQPSFVTAKQAKDAIAAAYEKKGNPALKQLRFEKFTEGKAAQIMYIGAYKDEGPTIARLHEFIAEQGGKLRGKHHEIYLGDPRRTAPSKLRTVIRQPFA